ncbi:MAG: VTT domain-containing protein, partial [Planctomycetota bacterium]
PADAPGWLLKIFAGGGAAGAAWLPGSLFIGTFITEDLSCVAAGIFAAEGRIDFLTATIACTLGIWLGDIGLYLIGLLTAKGLLRWGWAKRKMEGLREGSWGTTFAKHGNKILFTSRFLPGTRVPSYLAAGAIGFPLWRFAGVLGVAVVIWTPLLVGASAVFGRAVLDVLETWGAYAWLAVPVALLAAWCLVRLLTLLCSWHGRRLLVGKWRRLTRWEYWSPLFVFPPVVLDLLRLAIRHRTPAVFTACNRGIPYGGLFGESKGEILDLFGGEIDCRASAQRVCAPEFSVRVAAWRRLPLMAPLEDRLGTVAAFLAADGRCVLKPDQGERGSGVVVVSDLDEARCWLASCPYDAMVQQFVGGVEFGVAWCRDPISGRGRIDSIAHKELPLVVGDGQHSLEELILLGDRTLPMAELHLEQHAARRTWVPADGEEVRLGDLGTHARGATFYDRRELATKALHDAMDAFLGDVAGVDFGRFDLRAPSEAALAAGRGIEILEFNGVTGEAAHVYQPGYPWHRGVGDMMAHMRRASRVGAHNRRQHGHKPATLRQLVGVFASAFRRPKFAAPGAAAKEAEPDADRPVSNALARDPGEA